MSSYKFFIDESGDHSLQNINPDFPYFILCGILISDTEYTYLEQKIKTLKLDFFDDETIILHSRDIRRREKCFKTLFNTNIRNQFFNELNAIIRETDFQIISVSVRKQAYHKKYGYTAKNPYHISLEYIMERLVRYIKTNESVSIFVEKRGKVEDSELLKQYNLIRSLGTFYIKSSEFINKIQRFDFRSKTENDIGIQIADLCAYPISSYLRDSQEITPAFELIKPKFLEAKNTIYGVGLKVLP